MGTVGCLHDCQHPVARNPHPVPEPLEVVHDAFDGGHDATPGRPRSPDAVEEGLRKNQVAGGVGGCRMDEGDVGGERLQQTQWTKG